MYNVACETGNLLKGMFNFIGATSFTGPCRTDGYIVAFIFGLSLLGVMDKAVYNEIKY
jgi:hypothetical protein